MAGSHSSRGKTRDPFVVLRKVAYEFEVEKLAPLVGIPLGTLYNKLNCNESSHHKPTLADFIQITVATRDYRALIALNQTLDHVAFHVDGLDMIADDALLELLARVGAESGDFYDAILHGLKKSRFTKEAAEAIRKEGMEAIAAIVEAINRMEGLVDE